MLTCGFCKLAHVLDADEAIQKDWAPDAYMTETDSRSIGPICPTCHLMYFHQGHDGCPVANTVIINTAGLIRSAIIIMGENN